VGDIFFRQKCYERLERLRQQGVTILLVSHAMPEVEQFCHRALLLDAARVAFQGNASEAVKRYYLLEQQAEAPTPASPQPSTTGDSGGAVIQEERALTWAPSKAFLDIDHVAQVSNGWARCTGVAICDADGRPCRVFEQGQTASFFYEFELSRDIDVPVAGLEILNEKGVIVHGKNTLEYGSEVPLSAAGGMRLRFRQDISLELAVGEYVFTMGLAMMARQDYEARGSLTHTDLSPKVIRLCHLARVGVFTVVYRHSGHPVQLLHHGVANLPGSCAVTVVNHATAGRLNEIPA
jgi:hypothetical protein